MHKMNYENIPKFTRTPSYRASVDWDGLEAQIERWTEREGGIASIDLEPDFQREHVWTPEQQTAYIEYILRGGVSGREIYFNCVGWMNSFKGPFVIVDGKQRIQAVREFLKGNVKIFGKETFNTIEGRLPYTASFYFNVNDLKTREEVLVWYLEMNTGGTPHTEQEIQKVEQMLKQEKNK